MPSYTEQMFYYFTARRGKSNPALGGIERVIADHPRGGLNLRGRGAGVGVM
jgi:hypothetical protein